MRIKTKLAVNAITILLLMTLIGAAAVIGIKHIEKNIFYLTQKSTPYQIKTFNHQRALQAHASNLLKVAASESVEEYRQNADRATASLREEIEAADELTKLGSSSDYNHAEFIEITGLIQEITRKRLALQQDTLAAAAAMRSNLTAASGRLQALDASIRKLQVGATQKMVSNIVITADSNNQAALIASLLNGLKDLNLFSSRVMSSTDKDEVESLYEGTSAPLHKMTDTVGLIGWSGKLGPSDFTGKIDYIGDKLTEAKDLRLKFLATRDPAANAKAVQAIRDAETELTVIHNSAKMQADKSRSVQDASADAMSSSTAAFSSTNTILILASGILFSSAVIDSQINYSISVRNLSDLDKVTAVIAGEFSKIDLSAVKLDALLAKGKFKTETRQVADSLAALRTVQTNYFGKAGASGKIRACLTNVDEVVRLNQKVKAMVARQMELSGRDVAVAQQSQQGAVSSVKSAVNTTTSLIVLIAGLSVLASILLGRWIGLSITRPIEELSLMAERFGAGDFGIRMDTSKRDEFGNLAVHFNQATTKLAEMTGLLKQSIDKLSRRAESLHRTSEDLYRGAEEQVSQTTQSSVAMAEISATVETVAGHARKAAAASKEVHAIAANGNLLVTRTVDGMREISDSVLAAASTIDKLSESSERIDSILVAINDIADQTNLLALNAAIEAARAGEQGRGFAVVADEVRKLSCRTAEATREIAEVIRIIQFDTAGSVSAMNEGTSKVENGTELVRSASDSLCAIVAVSQQGVEMAGLIATATDEQAVVSREISESMDRIARVTGALKDSTVAVKDASSELSIIAGELNGMAGWFR